MVIRLIQRIHERERLKQEQSAIFWMLYSTSRENPETAVLTEETGDVPSNSVLEDEKASIGLLRHGYPTKRNRFNSLFCG